MPSPLTTATRRRFLGSALGAGLLAGTPLHAAGVPARIVSLDDGLIETLILLGAPPIAIPQSGDWSMWVVEPPLPPGIVNLGSALEPNLELLLALRPDLILTTPYLERVRPLLARIAPTERFSIYAPDVGDPYEASIAATRRLAGLLGREAQSEALIAASATLMASMREKLTPQAGTPLYVVNFMDTRHVRVYGAKSLFQNVMDRCGLTNAWQGETNYWGFATVGIEQLARVPEARLIYLEPVSDDVLATLARSPLWNSLAFVRAGRVQRMPAALMFGMLPSAMRFARLLGETLTGKGSANG